MGVAVAVWLGMRAVAQITGEVRAHQDHGDIDHRHVDALAATAALALEQRCGQRKGASGAGRILYPRPPEPNPIATPGPVHPHSAGCAMYLMALPVSPAPPP